MNQESLSKRIEMCVDSIMESFPELQAKNIKVIFKKGAQCMLAQPTPASFFKKRNQRAYRLIVTKNEPFHTFIQKMPDDAIRGWLAHELCHLVSYEEMTHFELIMFGFRYVFNTKFRRDVERETDYAAVKRGFKSEMLAAEEAVIHSTIIADEYKRYLEEYHLSADEIQEM